MEQGDIFQFSLREHRRAHEQWPFYTHTAHLFARGWSGNRLWVRRDGFLATGASCDTPAPRGVFLDDATAPLRLLASAPCRLLSAAGEHVAIAGGAFWEAAAQRLVSCSKYYNPTELTGLS
eukprot:COSAG01_NODE_10910_length_2053_cov_2.265097_1_plen_121_part_00